MMTVCELSSINSFSNSCNSNALLTSFQVLYCSIIDITPTTTTTIAHYLFIYSGATLLCL